jgi:hypothetical protein
VVGQVSSSEASDSDSASEVDDFSEGGLDERGESCAAVPGDTLCSRKLPNCEVLPNDPDPKGGTVE